MTSKEVICRAFDTKNKEFRAAVLHVASTHSAYNLSALSARYNAAATMATTALDVFLWTTPPASTEISIQQELLAFTEAARVLGLSNTTIRDVRFIDRPH